MSESGEQSKTGSRCNAMQSVIDGAANLEGLSVPCTYALCCAHMFWTIYLYHNLAHLCTLRLSRVLRVRWMCVCAGTVSGDVFISNLAAAVSSARSMKAQIAAIETFTAVASRLEGISHPASRYTPVTSECWFASTLTFVARYLGHHLL